MKVLQAGIFTDHELGGCLVFEKGLRQNGCQVERFDYPELTRRHGAKKMNLMLAENSRNKDLVLIGKGRTITRETLRSVRRQGVQTALWYGDIRPRPQPWLLDLLPEVDCYFMSSGGGILKEYHTQGKPKLAAFYFNPSDPELVERYKGYTPKDKDIVFTGNGYGFSDQARVDAVKYLLTRPDVTFYGGAERLLANRRSIWSRGRDRLLQSVGLKPRLPASKRVQGPEYIQAIKSARIGIGVSARQDVPKYTSDRLSHYLEFGTFYLCWRFKGIEELFTNGKELAVVESAGEMDQRIKYFLQNAADREEIAAAGQRRMLEEYNTKNITAMMLDIISTGKSDRFPWVEICR